MDMETKKKFFMDCHLAGRKYHEADEVWDQLKVGTELQLVRDLDNRYDPNAVAVVFRDVEREEDFCIGYLPRAENETVASMLEMGWTDVFECRICKINGEAHPESQIQLTIKIKRRQ